VVTVKAHHGAPRFISLLCACSLAACGARTGVDQQDLEPRALDGGAMVPSPLDGAVERDLDRPPMLDAGCDGAPLPSPRFVREVTAPTRLAPVVLHDATRRRALVFGGLVQSGRQTRDVYAVSATDATTRPIPLSPAGMELPHNVAIAWIDPGRTALMVGGVIIGGEYQGRVYRIDVTDNAVQLSAIGEHPAGVVVGATAVYDPLRSAIVVHGGEGNSGADERPLSTTWLLRLDGSTARWEPLVDASDSPPRAAGRSGGVDPRTGAVVLLGGYTRDGVDRSVWVLSAGPRPRWARLIGASDVIPRSGGALEWDPVGCGFLIVGGRCADQLWLSRPDGTHIREARLGPMRNPSRGAALGVLGAGVVFDPTQRTLVAIAGTDCNNSGFTVAVNALVEVR